VPQVSLCDVILNSVNVFSYTMRFLKKMVVSGLETTIFSLKLFIVCAD